MAEIIGTEGPDRLPGTPGDDVFTMLGDNDVVFASSGKDTVDGGAGSDAIQFVINPALGGGNEAGGGRLFTVSGDRSDGRIVDIGGQFDTRLTNVETLSFSNSGPYALTLDASGSRGFALGLLGSVQSTALQRIIGSAGNDRISARGGLLNIDAGAGIDLVSVGAYGPTVAIQNAVGAIELHQFTADGRIAAVISNAEQLSFFVAPPTAGALFDASVLSVGVELQGSGFNDLLVGGSGNDALQLTGRGSDVDFVLGGLGADNFYAISFQLLSASTRIGDFEGRDQIDFSLPAEIDDVAPHYLGGAAFTGVVGEYRMTVEGRSTVIEIDGDGDGQVDSRIVLGDRGLLLHETSAGSNILEVDTRAGLRVGTLAADQLRGDSNANFLFGYAGNDQLEAGAGNDLVEGGTGDDVIRGGTGADVYLFDMAEDGTGQDRISDFGINDVLVTTEALFDSNRDGRINFGGNRVLDFFAEDGDVQGQVSITGENGRVVTGLEYDGFVDVGDIRYFVYSRIGSAADVATLTNNSFFDLLG